MKKRITPLQLAVLFTGSFLGAGFLSGQELLQFFGQFGGWGLAGMALSIAAFALFGLLVLYIARRTGQQAFDRIIVRRESPLARRFMSAVFLIFLFGVLVGMIAGAGALLEQLTGLPALAGDGLFALAVFLAAITGAAGMLASFTVVVPLLTAAALLIAVLAFALLPAEAILSLPFSGGNPLLGNWLFSALSFLSYNMMGAVTILVPLARDMEDGKSVPRGLALGAALLTLIFLFILLPMICFRSLVGEAELPMLALAGRISPALELGYAVLLLCGMFTAALSTLFGITARLEAARGSRSSRLPAAVLCTLAFAGSIFGFKNVVSYFYPVCGYVGFLALFGIALHARFLRKNPQCNQQLSD